MSDQTPLDVEAIRAELAAMAGRPWTAEAAEYFIGRLLDENARLNAENERIRAMTKLHRESVARQRHKLEQKLIGWREAAEKAHAELDKVIRETAADKARLAAKVEAANAKVAEWDLTDEQIDMIASDSSPVRRAEKWLKLTSHRVCAQSLRSALADAAPEMPRPPAEEAAWSDADRVCAFDGCGESCRHDEENPVPPAQEPVSGPETAGTGSGRGTGATEAPGAAQDGEEA